MDLQSCPPPLVRPKQSLYREDIQNIIVMVGMASDSAMDVVVDGQYFVLQIHPTNSIVLAPKVGQPHPSFDEFVFYTHCLSYEHELPAFIQPVDGRMLIEPPIKGRTKRERDIAHNAYYSNLEIAYESLNRIRLGSLGFIEFRWSDIHQIRNLEYMARYKNAAKELSLYSTALRQLDPLSEFLSYYRVIESISGNNGKDWIKNHLPIIKNYDFGFLEYRQTWVGKRTKRRNNLFSIYRRKALARVAELAQRIPNADIPRYLYNETRCGIAHGAHDVREYDFSYNVAEIAKDIFIVKLLARIGIDSLIDKTVIFPQTIKN